MTAVDHTTSRYPVDDSYRDQELRYAPSPRVQIEEVGNCLLVCVGGARGGPGRAVARALPAEDDRVSVIVPDLSAAIVPQLLDRLRDWVPIKWDSVRLIAAGAVGDLSGRSAEASPVAGHSTASPAARRHLAQQLADGLGVEVIAPDGDILCVPGGSLFIAGAAGTEEGPRPSRAWWRLRPGRDPQQLGRRFPEPEWERYLDALPLSQFGPLTGVVVEQVPCGLWVRRPGPVRADDLVYAVPAHPDAITLVVSRPGDRPLGVADIRRLIVDLPAPVRERLVLVPYGDEPVADGRLGAVGSEAANQTLRVRTGLPLQLVGQGRHVVAVSRTGTLGWRPFAVELAWRPYGGARVHSWVSPAESLLPIAPAQLALNDRWLIEVVEAGLWIRATDRLDGANLVRELPVEAGYCTVVVGAPDSGQQQTAWRTIAKLLRELPSHARSRIRIAVCEEASERLARPAARLQARLVGGEAWLLCAGGRDGGRLVPLTGNEKDADEEVVVADVFGPPVDDRSETARLLSFVDELRRTPASGTSRGAARWWFAPAGNAAHRPRPGATTRGGGTVPARAYRGEVVPGGARRTVQRATCGRARWWVPAVAVPAGAAH